MKPYRIAAETDEYIIYEFKTGYIYALYKILILMLVGIVADIAWLSFAGMAAMLIFSFLSHCHIFPFTKESGKLRAKTRLRFLEVSGPSDTHSQ